jgi:hypothetical protein
MRFKNGEIKCISNYTGKPMGLFPKKIFCSLNRLISEILEISPWAYFRV